MNYISGEGLNSVQVRSVNGQIVINKQQFDSDHEKLNTEELRAGTYFIHTNTNAGTQVSKLVVQ